MLRSVVAGVMIASAVCGCRGEAELRCEPTERYTGAASIPPVRVPDDLSVPDESNSLRLPPPSAGEDGHGRAEGLPRESASLLPGQPPRGSRQPAASEPEPDPAEDPERQIGN